MNSFIVESFKEFSRVHFYTVRWDEQEDSETDRFLARYMNDETYKEELIEILTLIEDIGENRGAQPFLFSRFENRATALPPNFKFKISGVVYLFPANRLRLYCMRLSGGIVILFNGGVKESLAAQDSPDLSMKFHDAQHFAKKIEEYLREKDIVLDTRNNIITSPYGDEIVIY